jgi:chromodomain-helicase-DNA-binding protein 4
MLEEQARMEETEQAKKKQRQVARKAAAAAAAESAKANKVGSVKTRMVNSEDTAKLKSGDDEFDADQHQDYCDVCQAGGEIILCDTCPKAFHLVCLEPELEEAPEGEWFCPHCEKDGVAAAKKAQNAEALAKAAVDIDGILHLEYCAWCKDGGELICCETCPQSYHIDCLHKPLSKVPTDAWYCPKCSCQKPKGVVKKILTWRWKTDYVPPIASTKKSTTKKIIEDDDDENNDEDDDNSKKAANKKKKTPLLKIKLKKPAKKKGSDDEDDEQGIFI